MPRKRQGQKQVFTYLPIELYEELQTYVDGHQPSMPEILRRAAQEWLDDRRRRQLKRIYATGQETAILVPATLAAAWDLNRPDLLSFARLLQDARPETVIKMLWAAQAQRERQDTPAPPPAVEPEIPDYYDFLDDVPVHPRKPKEEDLTIEDEEE